MDIGERSPLAADVRSGLRLPLGLRGHESTAAASNHSPHPPAGALPQHLFKTRRDRYVGGHSKLRFETAAGAASARCALTKTGAGLLAVGRWAESGCPIGVFRAGSFDGTAGRLTSGGEDRSALQIVPRQRQRAPGSSVHRLAHPLVQLVVCLRGDKQREEEGNGQRRLGDHAPVQDPEEFEHHAGHV